MNDQERPLRTIANGQERSESMTTVNDRRVWRAQWPRGKAEVCASSIKAPYHDSQKVLERLMAASIEVRTYFRFCDPIWSD